MTKYTERIENYLLTKDEKNIYDKNVNNIINITPKQNGFVSLFNNMIKFNIFQYKPYLKLISNDKKCVYIADEVGAGKTFETGIIISELLYSKKLNFADDILIICPNMLCKKWQEVLYNNFGLANKIIKNIKELSGLCIISFDSISKNKDEIKNLNNLKMLIIDEAHNANGIRFEKINSIRENQNLQYTVLISATPLAGKDEDKLKQTKLLLNEYDGTFEFKENSYFCKTLKDDMRDKTVDFEITNIKTKNILLDKYIDISNDIFVNKNTILKFAGLNMINSSLQCAKKYIDNLYSFEDEKIEQLFFDSVDNDDEIFDIFEEDEIFQNENELISINEHIKNIKQKIVNLKDLADTLNQQDDEKLYKLKEIIQNNKSIYESGQDDYKFYKKVVVFTNFNETANYLNENIENSIVINGLVDADEKWKKFNQFKDENSGKDVLIITNVACEGQDMDFCNTIINYDLTYNPVQLAQRKGRVDRFEVKTNKKYIYNFYTENIDPEYNEIVEAILTDTLQNLKCKYNDSIYTVLLQKLHKINEETGIYYNIIDNIGESTYISDKETAKKRKCEIENLFNKYSTININDINVNDYLKNMLNDENIAIENITEDEIVIKINKNDKEKLKNIFNGATINSHLIYNN